MEALKNALVVDAAGSNVDRYRLIATRDFDELAVWTRKDYMPYNVLPDGRFSRPDSDLHAVPIAT